MQINDFVINVEGEKLDVITLNGKMWIKPLACNHIQIISINRRKKESEEGDNR